MDRVLTSTRYQFSILLRAVEPLRNRIPLHDAAADPTVIEPPLPYTIAQPYGTVPSLFPS